MSALVSWDAPLDPSEVKDYTHSFAAEMERTGDSIVSSTFILPTEATAAGLQIDSQPQPSTTEGRVFFAVDPAKQADAGWEDGVTFRVRHQITTAAGRTLERSINLTVRQL